MTDAQNSDAMKNLLWFITGLAILGILIAVVLYFTHGLPVQPAAGLHPPSNANPMQIFGYLTPTDSGMMMDENTPAPP